MKKLIAVFMFIALSVGAVDGNGNEDEGLGGNSDKEKELVCCEHYGVGAYGVKGPSSFYKVTSDECKLPRGLTGAGREIVDMSKCSQGSEVMKKPDAP